MLAQNSFEGDIFTVEIVVRKTIMTNVLKTFRFLVSKLGLHMVTTGLCGVKYTVLICQVNASKPFERHAQVEG
jgi:hypothetical protein